MTSDVLPEALLDQIRDLHSGPDRGYHGWSHPLALLALLREVEDRLHDPLAVRCAILLHDAVYEPRRADNEDRSAALARDLLTGVIAADTLERTIALIEATKAHAIPDGLAENEAADMAVFLDMDLSILAASDAAFDAYEDGVRHEYREVPADLFRMGRASILEGFLARDHLYMSPWGLERFEGSARINLRRSIDALRAA
jgi:predicted metal-dependent HD superfamily phosphohydrolase